MIFFLCLSGPATFRVDFRSSKRTREIVVRFAVRGLSGVIAGFAPSLTVNEFVLAEVEAKPSWREFQIGMA